jgi:exopolyphosphatase/guanosine-5'-triphosphate,3'-diphosphate pyrophosphatase
MADHFAVVDVGSNAMRFQVASVVDGGRRYEIVEQDRKAVRLGHQVFQTGRLDPKIAEAALAALSEFKDVAARHKVRAMRAVGTAALREASDSRAFLARCKKIGMPLEILPEEEEARLIAVGIMSGLQFHLPLGLFLDIGGGSLELSVADTTNNYCMFSLPLGTVRLTERFFAADPPRHKEIKTLRCFVQDELKRVVRRIQREKFTMVFGSAGTVTTLADTDTRLTGETKVGSLTVLRRPRLRALMDRLKREPASRRASLISGDPKRADIIIAGGIVLLEFMTQLELDYLFVSQRGLRDGLMIDLLHKYYTNAAPGQEDAEDGESLEQIGYKYTFNALHARQVAQLALSVFYQLQKMHQLDERHAAILRAAAMLHDIGTFISFDKHHKHSYYLIKSSRPSSFNKEEVDLIANVARYHRKAHPSPKHLGFSQLSPSSQKVVRKLSAILRVADALDYNREQNVKEVKCALASPETLSIEGIGSTNLKDELQRAHEKGTLMREVFNVKLVIRQAKAMPKIVNESDNERGSDAPHPLREEHSISRRR